MVQPTRLLTKWDQRQTMNDLLPFLVRHSYVIVFLWVFAEQIGLPVPSTIILLAAGALAGAGDISLIGILLVALAATVISDVIWYEVGRRKGMAILSLLCRISLEPDSCVRRTQERFARSGPKTLLLAKFLPGLNTAAPPLAGMFHMPFLRFLVFDLLGAVFWVASFVGVGYVFSRQLEELMEWSNQLGLGLAALLAVLLLGYFGWKYYQRQRFIRELRVVTISPEDLRQKLEEGGEPFIVDLRHSLDFAANPFKLPGALQMVPAEVESRHHELPRDRDIILYCT